MIINEVGFVEKWLAKRQVPDHMGIKTWLKYLIKYFYQSCIGMSLKEYKNTIIRTMDKFNVSPAIYQEWKYGDWIYNRCGNARKGKFPTELRRPKEVVITKPEMDLINSANNERERKFLFTLYVLAKIIPNPSGWVNCSLNELFKLANLSVPAKDRGWFMGNIDRQGLLDYDHTLRTYGNKVRLIDGEPEIIITDFENLGRQYIILTKPEWKMCKVCGKLIKKTSNVGRPLLYCKDCAEKIRKQQNILSVQKSRELSDFVGKNPS